MRKGLAILALLLALSVTVLAAGARHMDARRTAISITEQTLYGDPAAVSGLRVSTRASCENHLFWDTTYMAGADPQPETVFTYSNQRVYEQWKSDAYFYLEPPSLNAGMSGVLSGEELARIEDPESEEYDDNNEWLMKPVMDVASRTAAGESRTETVCLADYYETYPLTCHLNPMEPYTYMGNSLRVRNYLNRYFPIPVSEDLELQVTVEKNAAGEICRFEYNQMEGIEAGLWYCSAAVLEDGVFFGLFGNGDFSQIEGGYGLYYLPITVQPSKPSTGRNAEEGGLIYFREETCENVCPLELNSTDGQLLASSDGKQVYALTLEGGHLMLTVLDGQSREILQRQDTGWTELPATTWQEDGILVLVTGDEAWEHFSIQVWMAQADGTLRQWLEAPLYGDGENPRWYVGAKLCFDGQRLAIVRYRDNYNASSHWISVYDETGLQYVGEYHHSGDDLTVRLNTWDSGLEAEWEDD